MRTLKFRSYDTVEQNYCKFIPEHLDRELYPHIKIEQFTGLTDHYGEEIYEGDIIEYYRLKTGTEQFYPDRTKRKAVVWEEYNRCIGYNLRPVIKKEGGYWEVIGNIYEHGHLLENKSKKWSKF